MSLNYKDQLGFDVKLDNVRESISKAEKGIVNIKCKDYSTVGLRLNKLREHFGVSISIINKIIENTDDEYSVKDVVENGKTIQKKYISKDGKIVVESKIYLNTENGRIFLANGFAEKRRALNNITRTSCLEFCQTTAMGRACAGLGIIGDHNIASVEEIRGAQDESVPDKNINKE